VWIWVPYLIKHVKAENLYLIAKNSQHYNTQLIHIDENVFKEQIVSLGFLKSLSVSLDTIVFTDGTDSDDSHYYVRRLRKLIGELNSPLYRMQKIAEYFNNRTLVITQNAERECIDLMTTAYKYDIFDDWHTVKPTTVKRVPPIDSLYLFTPFSAFYIGKKISEFVYSGIDGTTKSDIQTDKNSVSEKLFIFSKIYCLNSFNMQMVIDTVGHNISLIGDKIDYKWLNNLLTILLSNINLKLDKMKMNVNNDATVESILISCKQKLRVLKDIVHIMGDLVSHSFYTMMNKHIISVHSGTIDNIRKLLNDQLNYLQSLNDLLIRPFPEYEQQLAIHKGIVEEQRRLKEKENELKLFKQYTQTMQTQFESNFTKHSLTENFKVFKIVTTSYIQLLSQTIDLGAFSLRNISRTCVGLVASVPIGLMEGISYNLTDLLWLILKKYWVVILVAFVVYRIFKKISKNFGL